MSTPAISATKQMRKDSEIMPFYNGKKKECTEDSAPHPPILNYDEERSLPQTSYANFTIYMWTCGEERCQDQKQLLRFLNLISILAGPLLQGVVQKETIKIKGQGRWSTLVSSQAGQSLSSYVSGKG